MAIKAYLMLIGTFFIMGTITAQPRYRESAVAQFLGAITGATFAEEAFGNQCYYQDGPAYLYVYPGAPLYAYDYPTYVYAPQYAYPDMRHAIYPSYYFSR